MIRGAALILAITASIALQAKDRRQDGEIVKNGWNVGPLPITSYNTDLGFQYGICADIFNYKGVYPDYRQRIYVEASRFTKGQSMLYAQFDSRYVIPGVRMTVSATYQHDPYFMFYGLNGLEPYDPELNFNKDTRTARYAYTRTMTRILASFQWPVADNLELMGGLAYWRITPSDIGSDTYDPLTTLFHEMYRSGVLDERDAEGGSSTELVAGIVYDSRDLDSAPQRGIYANAGLNASLAGFLKANVHFRQYVSLAEPLVFAYHLAWQGTVAGSAPFWVQQNVNTLYIRQSCTDGLGGINTVRGLLAQRLVGDSYAWANVELRLKLASFRLFNQNWDIGTNPFFDAGMLTSVYKKEELAAYYSLSAQELTERALKLHCAAGIGLKLVMNRNFVCSADIGFPLSKEDGTIGIYTNMDYIF